MRKNRWKTTRSRRRRRPGLRWNRTRFLLIALEVILLTAVVTGILLWLEYRSADLRFPDWSEVGISTEDGENYLVSWPQLESAERYAVKISRASGGKETGEVLWRGECEENICQAGKLSAEEIVIAITPVGRFRTLFGSAIRHGSEPLTVTAQLDAPSIGGLEYSMDAETQLLTARFDRQEPFSYALWMVSDGIQQKEREIEGEELTVSFGAEGDYPIPAYEEPACFAIRASRQGNGYVLTGPAEETIVVSREKILTRVMELSWEHLGENRYSFTWNETLGRKFLVQRSLDGYVWETLAEVGLGEELKYDTEMLHSGTSYIYRVEAVENDESVVAEDEAEIFTELMTLSCTIWPVKELPLYAADTMADTGIQTEALKAYRVLGEKDGSFLVEEGGTQGYIDSNYCLINLSDYLGQLCSYDIVNSYSALYMMHGFEIPEITDTVIWGYEDVLVSEGEYLVPYLYPCCEKLIAAARAALADGYRLKIYDAYRPHEATEELYQTAELILDDPLPVTITVGSADEDAETVEGAGTDGDAGTADAPEEWPEDWSEEDIRELKELIGPSEEDELLQQQLAVLRGMTDPQTEAGSEETEAAAEESEAYTEEEIQMLKAMGLLPPDWQPAKEKEIVPVYRNLVTNGSYKLSNFLARVGSAHNMGIALDLTLETLDGEELEMQTRMHDLSWYATIDRNNEYANLLNKYMTGAGFAILRSEWWHFQDNETRDALELDYYQYGVTRNGLGG